MSRPSSLKLSLLALVLPAALTACSSLVADQEGSGRTSEATSVSAADASAILDLVDDPDTDVTLLDITIKLDSRAAKNIVAARNGKDGVCPSADDAPFTSLSALEAVPYVGDSAIGKLEAYAAAHPAPRGEVVEGVTFLGWESAAVVWGVNHSSLAELDAFLDTRAAHALVAGAPFTTVAQMGPLSYVGDKALNALLAHAIGWWTASKAPSTTACIDAFEAAVGPSLGDLLFMSESDRPFDIVAFPGAGGTPPTAASVLGLVDAAPGSTAEQRATGDYYVALEPSGSPAANAVQSVFESQLTDVIYVAVHAPAGSDNTALVDVYLVGRTTCGDLVGIHAIAVET